MWVSVFPISSDFRDGRILSLRIFFFWIFLSTLVHEDTPWILLTVQSKQRCLCSNVTYNVAFDINRNMTALVERVRLYLSSSLLSTSLFLVWKSWHKEGSFLRIFSSLRAILFDVTYVTGLFVIEIIPRRRCFVGNSTIKNIGFERGREKARIDRESRELIHFPPAISSFVLRKSRLIIEKSLRTYIASCISSW